MRWGMWSGFAWFVATMLAGQGFGQELPYEREPIAYLTAPSGAKITSAKLVLPTKLRIKRN